MMRKLEIAAALARVPPFRAGIAWLSGAGAPVFTFHRVLPEHETCYDPEIATSTGLFEAFIRWVCDRYQAVPLEELVTRTMAPKNGGKPLCAITFDDGWHDNFLHAFPILQRHQLPATVFLPTRFIGTNRRFWQETLWFSMQELTKRNDSDQQLEQVLLSLPWCPRLSQNQLTFKRLRRLLLTRPSHEAEEFVARVEEIAGPGAVRPGRRFLTWEEVRTMQNAGIDFGSHTLNHTLLTRADPSTAWNEIVSSHRELAERLGSPPVGFAYPWGATGRQIRRHVKDAGYALAVTTAERLVRESSDRWLVPRLNVSDSILEGRKRRFDSVQTATYIALKPLKTLFRGRKGGQDKQKDKRLRVALVVDTVHWWQGGTEQHLRRLLAALDRQYFEPELCFLKPSAGIPMEQFPCPVNLLGRRPEVRWYDLVAFWRLVQHLRAWQPDIVQTFFRDATYYGTLAGWLARVPTIVCGRRNAGHWRRGVDRLGLKLANRLADSWQCNSRTVAEDLRATEGIPAERIEILPNAVDLDSFSPPTQEQRLLARKQLGLSSEAPVFVAVANLTSVKDIGTLVEAAGYVRQLLPASQFLVLGEGPLRSDLTGLIDRRGLSSTVRLLGSRSDVRPFLTAADIGLLTSRSEGSSNSVLEYMAMGLPAALSNIPANRDLVDRVFFRPGDPNDLAAKILELWNDPDSRAEMRSEYRRRAMEYGLDAFATRVQSYYSSFSAQAL
jgi:glycosyltransferase involved in cell wall biosynthesis/peptidoglycan/xylan/chitin deacetylase (PgdA/CDA1 family)